MRRGNIGSPRLCALLDSGGYIHPVLVHGHRYQTAARALEDAARQAVPGFLDPNGASVAQENARRNLQGLLGTSNHHYLTGIAADRPRGSQVSTDGLATTFRTPRIGIVDRAEAWAFGVTRDQARPNGKRKVVKRRLMHAKRSPATHPRRPVVPG